MLLDVRKHDLKILMGLIGLVQGLCLYVLVEHGSALLGPTPLVAGLIVFAATAPLCAYISFDPDRQAASALFALAIGAVLGLLHGLDQALIGDQGVNDFLFYASVTIGVVIVGCVSLTFFQTWLERGFRFPYEDLFEHGWTNAMLLAVASAYTGAAWLVLTLWQRLFGLVGILVFRHIFTNTAFEWIFTCFAAGISLAIAREHAKLVYTLRDLCITLARILAPILALIAILFLAVLPFTGLAPLWKTAAATPILLSVIGISVLFMTGVVNDGKSGLAGPAIASWIIAIELAVMPILAGLALWGTGLRIHQYGLTPARIFSTLLIVVAGAHALAYCYGVLRYRSAWPSWVTCVNPPLAIGVVALVLLAQMPGINPYAVSARDQMARLQSGRVDSKAFDLGVFKFDLGKYGMRALKLVEEDKTLPQRDVIEENLKTLAQSVTTFPAGATIPVSVLSYVATKKAPIIQMCKTSTDNTCFLIASDLDNDGTTDYLLVNAGPLGAYGFLLTRSARAGATGTDEWDEDTLAIFGYSSANKADFVNALKAGDIHVAMPRFQDLKIGQVTVQVIPTGESTETIRSLVVKPPAK
jgi:hypothetical protein